MCTWRMKLMADSCNAECSLTPKLISLLAGDAKT